VPRAGDEARGPQPRPASAPLTNKLQPIFRDLRLTVRVHLDEADASLIQSSKSAAQ